MGFIAVLKVLAGKEACIRVGRDCKVHCDGTFCEENYHLTGNLVDYAKSFLCSSDEMEDFAVKYA